MITRVVLGDGTELINVGNVTEIVQHNGDYVYNGISIDIQNTSNNQISVEEVQNIFSQPNVLKFIKVYKKDEVNRMIDDETKEEIIEYGDEYLDFETSKYTGIKSIYGDIASDRITISLNADHTKIADEKYNELLRENAILEQTILELTMIVGSDR